MPLSAESESMDSSDSSIFNTENPADWFRYVSTASENQIDSDQLSQTIIQNVDSISRIPRLDFVNSLSKINKETLKHLRKALDLHLKSKIPNIYVLKNRTAVNAISEDCFSLVEMVANNKVYDKNELAKIYMLPKDKDEEYLYFSIEEIKQSNLELINENKLLKKMITEQNLKIETLISIQAKLSIDFQKILNNTTATYSQIVSNKPNNASVTSLNNVFSGSTHSKRNVPNLINNATPVSSRPCSTNKRNHIETEESVNNNNNSNSNLNLIHRFDTNKKQKLKEFDSTDPNSESKELGSDSNAWTLAGSRRTKNQSNSNKVNQNKDINDDKSNKENQHQQQNQKKSSNRTKNWLKSVGSNCDVEFPVEHRLLKVYFGRASKTTTTNDVKKWLNNFKIQHWNLNELKTVHDKFKAYTFDINFLDREILNDDSLWPRGIIRNKFKRKKDENSVNPVDKAETNDINNTRSSTSTQIVRN